MSETPVEPTPDEVPEPTPDETIEEEEHESNPPTETDLPETEAPEAAPSTDEPLAEGEQAAQPEASGPQQAEWEEFWKKSERSFGTYKRVVVSNYPGDESDLMELSISPSAPPGFINKLDAGRVPQDVQDTVGVFFGLAREQEYKADPETETCAACGGEGKTKTGSSVPGHTARTCPRCKGWGYLVGGLAPTTRAPASNGDVAEAPELVAPLVDDDRDNWGEPRILPDGRENPNYGKQPQFKVAIEPWGITANLTAQDAAPVEA